MQGLWPPEWAPQAAMLFAWPRADGDCAANLNAVRNTIAAMVSALARTQAVVLLAPDAECRTSISAHPALAAHRARLSVVDCPANDIWLRDYGPITVVADGRRRFMDFRFDGWRGQYPAMQDDRATAKLYELGALGGGRYVRETHVLEGGSIEGNGDGTLLTTRTCLLDNTRNPGTSQADFAALFQRRFNVDTVHWLTCGALAGDDTHAHIDTLARFTAPDTIVYQSCADPVDSHYESLTAMAGELSAFRDRNGRRYKLRALPLPAPVHDPDTGRRLPAGYANFVIANHCVLMPTYNDPADVTAAQVLAACFPRRAIVSIDARALIRHNGALHCAAMQIPAHG